MTERDRILAQLSAAEVELYLAGSAEIPAWLEHEWRRRGVLPADWDERKRKGEAA